ncbi:60S ribosomal protein l12-3, partial [Phtheirospermum japonicum]
IFDSVSNVIPSSAILAITALQESERDRIKTRNIQHNGNISLDDIIGIDNEMRPQWVAKDLYGTVEDILGTGIFAPMEMWRFHQIESEIESDMNLGLGWFFRRYCFG